MSEMEGLLRSLMSPDNTLRRQAEDAYNTAAEGQLPQLVGGLLQLLGASADAVIRNFAAVLLRSRLRFTEFAAWQAFGPEVQAAGMFDRRQRARL